MRGFSGLRCRYQLVLVSLSIDKWVFLMAFEWSVSGG